MTYLPYVQVVKVFYFLTISLSTYVWSVFKTLDICKDFSSLCLGPKCINMSQYVNQVRVGLMKEECLCVRQKCCYCELEIRLKWLMAASSPQGFIQTEKCSFHM